MSKWQQIIRQGIIDTYVRACICHNYAYAYRDSCVIGTIGEDLEMPILVLL